MAGIILCECLGMKNGRKTEINPTIPWFVAQGNDKIKSSFLQQIYDDEGWVYFKKESSQRSVGIKFANKIEIQKELHATIKRLNSASYPPEIIKEIKLMNESFGIKTTNLECVDIYKTKKGIYNSKWVFYIRRKDNIYKFMDKISFCLKRKREKLIRAYNSFHDFEKSRANRAKIILAGCREIEMDEGNITSMSLSSKFDKSRPWSKMVIRDLRKKGYLLLEKPRHGTIGAKYKLVH